jgi:hypothetical protein
MNLSEWIIRRINGRSIAFVVSLLTTICGIVMIFMDIKDQGFIDIKSSLVSGNLQTGFVGVTLLFFGCIISIVGFLTKSPPHKLKIKKDSYELEWEGSVYSYESALNALKNLLEGVDNKDALANKTNSADAENRAAD